MATWTKKAIQISPESSVRMQRTSPRGTAPMVSSKPFGMWVAAYKAILMAMAGQTPKASTNGNRVPL